MKAILLVVAMTFGCVDYSNAWQVALGEECDSDPMQLCNDGYGLCFAGRCRAWCGLVTPRVDQRCADDEREIHMVYDTNPDACVCVEHHNTSTSTVIVAP